MHRIKEDFFREIDEIYEEINRLEKKANFFVEEKPCGDCDLCCKLITTIPVCIVELDYIKNRKPYSGYDEEKFITFLNRESNGRCPNYRDDIHGCGIYQIRPIVCRTFGYTMEPMARVIPDNCCYSNKVNPVWLDTEQQSIKFNILKIDYYSTFFEQIVPKTVYDYINLAEVSVRNKWTEKAIEFYDSAEKIFISSNNLRMFLTVKARKYEILEKQEKAVKVYCEILEVYPEDIKSALKLANLEFFLGKYDDCIKHLNEVLKYTKTPLIYNTLGLSYIRKGEYQKALEVYNIALKYNFENIKSLLLNKAIALQKMNSDEDAIALLQSLLEQNNNDDALIHLSLSISFQKIGDYQKALTHDQKAKALSSTIFP